MSVFEQGNLLPRNVADDASGPHLERMRADACVAQPPTFFGLNLGVFNLGVTDEGSITAGVNLGPLGHVQPEIGLRNGVNVAVGPPELGAGLNVEGGISRCGLYAQGDVGANALGLAGGGVGTDVRLGQTIGAGARGYGYAGPLEAAGGTHAYLSPDGLYTGAGAVGGVGDVVSWQAGANFDLNNKDSRLAGASGVQVGDLSLGAGAGIYSDRNSTIRPDVYVEGAIHGQYGRVDVIPPRQPGELPQVVAAVAAQPPIAVQPLAVPYTPSAFNAFSNATRQQLVDQSGYTVERAERTYLDVARHVMPAADEQSLRAEADYLERVNGRQALHAGMHISMLKAEDLDLKVRQITAMHFGMRPPSA